MHIGQIVTDDQNLNVSDYIKVVSPDDYVDDGGVVLIVGKDNVKRFYPDYKLKYIDRKIDDRHYWTFSIFEKRNVYESDIKKFKEDLFFNEFSKIRYVSLDFIYSSYSYAKKYINMLNDDNDKFVYVTDKSIYVYYVGVLYGISLLETNYIGISNERIINYIKKGNKVSMIFSDRFIGMNDSGLTIDVKYVPYLYFMSNL